MNPWRRAWVFFGLCSLLGLLGCAGGASADESLLVLKNGGQLRGTVVQAPDDDQPANDAYYIVRLSTGSRVKLAARQVRKVAPLSPAEAKYASLLPDMPDTAAGHLTMAQWCQDNKLNDLRLYHLEQVLRHEPDHEEARRSLGYGRIDGRWIKADDLMQQQGYVRYQGAWRLPQQVAIMEQVRKRSWRRRTGVGICKCGAVGWEADAMRKPATTSVRSKTRWPSGA